MPGRFAPGSEAGSQSAVDVEELDDEERKVVAEVAAKGYYHGRPRNGEPDAPRRVEGEAEANALHRSSACRGLPEEACSVTPGSCQPPLPPPPPAHGPGGEFADILGARDLYAAIGASVFTPEAELRWCYLRTAVRAHPGTEEATEEAADAFQQATAAWAELASATSRWRYDAELQAGRGLLAGPTRHRCLPLTSEKALSAFAAAASDCAAQGTPPRGSEETLRLAQQLVAGPAAEEPAEPSVVLGVATCAGLAAAGVVASAYGYPGVGLMARRAAVYQGLGQAAKTGASMYKSNDAVREKVDSVCSVLGAYAQEASSMLPPLAACLGDREPQPAPQQRAKVVRLPVGCHVRLVGLQSATSLNGHAGEVVGFRDARYEVRLLDHRAEGVGGASAGPAPQFKRLRPENLEPLGPRPGLEPPPSSEGAPQGAMDFF